MTLSLGERVVLIGDNGCGKSSLFKALNGDMSLTHGELTVGRHVRAGFLRQNVDCGLDLKQTPISILESVTHETVERHIGRLRGIGVGPRRERDKILNILLMSFSSTVGVGILPFFFSCLLSFVSLGFICVSVYDCLVYASACVF